MPFFWNTPRARYSRFTWCTMPMPGGHDLEGVEGLHAPLHELVALVVARELELHVEVERVRPAVVVDLHRVVDHQVHGHQRLDHLRVLAHLRGHAAHGGEVGQQRHAGEVLQHDAREDEGDLVGARPRGAPAGELLHVLLGHLLAVDVAQHRLEHDADRDRQALHVGEGLRERGQRVVLAGLAGGGLEGLEGVEGVVGHGRLGSLSFGGLVVAAAATSGRPAGSARRIRGRCRRGRRRRRAPAAAAEVAAQPGAVGGAQQGLGLAASGVVHARCAPPAPQPQRRAP